VTFRHVITVGTLLFRRHVSGKYMYFAYVNWLVGSPFWLDIRLERDATRRRVSCTIELRHLRRRGTVMATSHGHSNYSALCRAWTLLPQLKPLWGQL
jgi:hypothetical protein